MTAYAARFGAKGLAYLYVEKDGVRSPVAKFFEREVLDAVVARLAGEPGDLLLFVADKHDTACQALGALRLHLAERLGLVDSSLWNFLWVVDFPLLVYDEEEGRYVAKPPSLYITCG